MVRAGEARMVEMRALGTGLVVTEFTIGGEIAAEFGRWHSDEHIAERLEIEGMRSARRYICATDPLRFLCLYRAATSDVYQTAPYQALADKMSETTKSMLAAVKGVRLVGDVVRETGRGYGSMACRIRVTCAPADDGDVTAWFDAQTERLPGQHGVVRMTLVSPRRELPGVSDPSWIALVEGYDDAVLVEIASGGHRAPPELGEVSTEVYRLEHLVI
jgi:hypothetical protein